LDLCLPCFFAKNPKNKGGHSSIFLRNKKGKKGKKGRFYFYKNPAMISSVKTLAFFNKRGCGLRIFDICFRNLFWKRQRLRDPSDILKIEGTLPKKLKRR
jgi:hypothetical protein